MGRRHASSTPQHPRPAAAAAQWCLPLAGWLAGWQAGERSTSTAADKQGGCRHVPQEHPAYMILDFFLVQEREVKRVLWLLQHQAGGCWQ